MLVDAWRHGLDLADALSTECYLIGAVPLTIVSSDNLVRDMLDVVPENTLRRMREHLVALGDSVDAVLMTLGPYDPENYTWMSPQRREAFEQGIAPYWKRLRARRTPIAWTYLGEVTPPRAERYGVDYERWRESVIEGIVNTDYNALRARCRKLAGLLRNASSVHITAAGGTDITLRLGKYPPRLDYGFLDKSTLASGHTSVGLPDGVISIAPDEQRCSGKVVFDEVPFTLYGRIVRGLQLRFEHGRLIEYEAQEGLEHFQSRYRIASGDKDRIGLFSIGVNPTLRPVGVDDTDYMAAGAVRIGLGGNAFIGGRNRSEFSEYGVLFGATVALDRRTVVENGKLLSVTDPQL